MCLTVAVATASAGHLGCGDGVSGDGGALTLHLTARTTLAGMVTLAHVTGENMVHGRFASGRITTHDLLEELDFGGLGFCVGVTSVEIALIHVLASVSRDSGGGGKEREDDGLGEEHVDGNGIELLRDGSVEMC
ncbi:hypothetical protein MMC11_007894 [Xylographa trunciseda]|nr:hypothetical protein [Xylographa trunciseda]